MAYADDVWAAVPKGAEPELFGPRRDFLLRHVPDGARVLDVGCGEGAFAEALREAGASPVCVDVADEPLRRLRARFPQLTDVRRARPGEPLPLQDDEVDAVWAGEVIEHVVDVGAFCGELRRVLKPAGPLILTTPDHPRRLLVKLALKRGAFEEHFSPYADHLRFFTARTLIRVLEDAGFPTVALTRAQGHLLACAF
ncbi:MAG TPA: class I SAM-dependent methyltransferase [Solirubrobacteraceae bacterium]|jgi:2-polyprenyl-6-hydroxyphenyl methylase/3-demethylubiquinone-9 3-methyltransferase